MSASEYIQLDIFTSALETIVSSHRRCPSEFLGPEPDHLASFSSRETALGSREGHEPFYAHSFPCLALTVLLLSLLKIGLLCVLCLAFLQLRLDQQSNIFPFFFPYKYFKKKHPVICTIDNCNHCFRADGEKVIFSLT